MKSYLTRNLLLLLVFASFAIQAFSQIPQGFSYQAVIRNTSGQPLASQSVKIQITLIDEAGTTTHYKETHSITTSPLGLVNLSIGGGTIVSGTFSTIPWQSGAVYIKVEIDPAGGTSYTNLGSSKLTSVPYALYAASGTPGPQGPTGPIGPQGLTGNTGPIGPTGPSGANGTNGTNGSSIQWLGELAAAPNSPLLNQSYYNTTNKKSYIYDGDSWEIITQDGATGPAGPLVAGTTGQILVHDGTTWTATNAITVNGQNVGIGNLNPQTKLVVQSETTSLADDPIFEVRNKDNKVVLGVYNEGVRVYVADSPTSKGARGGFAVGGLTNQNKGTEREYFRITPDSARIYLKDTLTTKGARGGFAVGGLTTQNKGVTNNYLYIHRDSSRIYINDSPTKGARGGFAVGGLTSTKEGTITNDYFNISSNSELDLIGSEARILWYPVKAAFLAGEVHIGSADSVGTNSTSLGYRTIAMGNYSQAMGFKAQSLGLNSTAIGNSAIAKSNNSFAFGNNAQTQGLNSFAFGDSAISNGESSYALGAHAKTTGKNSFAMGSFGFDIDGFLTGPTVASGDYSYAFGMGSQASGKLSLAFGGKNNATGENSIAMGYGVTSSALNSFAIGLRNTASGGSSFALGNYTTASGVFSTTLGNATSASGLCATAMGFETTAIGDFSTVIGRKIWAYGNHSIAIGSFITANGEGSLALGWNTTTGGDFSTTMGYYTKATGANSTALGSGIEARGSNTFGIGISMVTSVITDDNTMAIMGGEVGIGTVSPDKLLHVAGDARIEGNIYYGASGSTTKYTKPDFVFKPQYENYLEPLKVAEFIKTNGHLPWMTSAREETDGINLTRMQFETLETVENLQLQIIELKKEHQDKITKQQSEIDILKTELEAIKALLKK
ncbi:MAG: hypothetical protein AB9846_07065 [Tenuifilaceae bacterium]